VILRAIVSRLPNTRFLIQSLSNSCSKAIRRASRPSFPAAHHIRDTPSSDHLSPRGVLTAGLDVIFVLEPPHGYRHFFKCIPSLKVRRSPVSVSFFLPGGHLGQKSFRKTTTEEFRPFDGRLDLLPAVFSRQLWGADIRVASVECRQNLLADSSQSGNP